MDVDILRRQRADEHAPSVVLDAVELAASAESAGAARQFVRTSLAWCPIDPDRLDDLVLAVSEAFTNAVEAQVRRNERRPIIVRCTAAIDAVAAEIEDHGGGIADLDTRQPRPALAHRDELGADRGWGIQLIRQLVDSTSFEPTPDGTCVRMAVRR